MTEQKIALEIVTPEKLVLQDQVDFVVLPARNGECGILPGHTHFLTQLSAGVLRITKGLDTNIFAVSGGFAEIHPGQVEVFAETAEMAEEIDVERARLAAQKAKDILTRADTVQEIESSQAALRRALIRLRISELISRKNRQR